ncbi:MAG TPA: nucleotidyltransferase family protein [Gammaproteobacteria bacterium]|nr:nucleotidyltransferase family protein [Gammaproteobacteria bacterium]HIL97286.1 nucleotidyltransferase family protein [Pseudomonadales bacterium]
MKAMILAAGEGKRMQPLTRDIPKPLLWLNGKTLIDHHVEALQSAGFDEVVINIHYLGEMIRTHINQRTDLSIKISFSKEPELLETAGGIKKALPLLGVEPFAVVSGDIYTDYDFRRLRVFDIRKKAHLVMVDNPEHHAEGDFSIASSGLLKLDGSRLTWGSIGIFSAGFFDSVKPGRCSLRHLFDTSIPRGELTGEYYRGFWTDVGTPRRLKELRDTVKGVINRP